MTIPEPAPIDPEYKLTTTLNYTCPHCNQPLHIPIPNQNTLTTQYNNHITQQHPDLTLPIGTQATYTPPNQGQDPQQITTLITNTNPNHPEEASLTHIHEQGITTITATKDTNNPPAPGLYYQEPNTSSENEQIPTL